MIISASRRTDIPAFYSKWFMNRIREGFLFTKNPFNSKQFSRVELNPEMIEAIVFWTRNPRPLISYLEELTSLGFNYYFQYTITGYPKIFEKNRLNTEKSIETLITLRSKIGPEKIIWRYDPIINSNITDLEFHHAQFKKIAEQLSGHCNRVMISFVDFYKKTKKNIKKIETETDIKFFEINSDDNFFDDICEYISKVAHENEFEIYSCAEDFDLSQYGIKHGKCIDEQLINELFKYNLKYQKDKNQREECGCMKSKDIGIYNSCLHGCEYCYANVNKILANKNFNLHDPNSGLLIGSITDENTIKKNKNYRLDQFL